MCSRREMKALVLAVEDHPELVNCSVTSGRHKNFVKLQNIWKMVAKQLNSNQIFKTPISGEEAKRKWCDLKYRTLKKVYALENSQTDTGGELPNPEPNVLLSSVEKRVLDMMRSKEPNKSLQPRSGKLKNSISLCRKSSNSQKGPTASTASTVPSSHIIVNAPNPSLGSVVPPGHIIVNAQSSSINSSLPSGHIIVHTPSPTTLPPSHLVIIDQAPIPILQKHATPILPTPATSILPSPTAAILPTPTAPILPTPTTPILSTPTVSILPTPTTPILQTQSSNLSSETPVSPLKESDLPEPILPDLHTFQTIANIKEEICEIEEVETDPPLNNILDGINISSNASLLVTDTGATNIKSNTSLFGSDTQDATNNTSTPSRIGKKKNLCKFRTKEFINKQKKMFKKKTEFQTLADIEERKMSLLKEQIRIKRENLKLQEKKTLIMEQQFAISREQLAVSKEQLAVSKQILCFHNYQGTSNEVSSRSVSASMTFL